MAFTDFRVTIFLPVFLCQMLNGSSEKTEASCEATESRASLGNRGRGMNGFKVDNIWEASVFAYLGFPLLRIELRDRGSEWTFDAPPDAQAYLDEYRSPQGLGCTNLKQYSMTFSRLNKSQNDLRHSGESVWLAPEPEMTADEWNSIQQQGADIRRRRSEFEKQKIAREAEKKAERGLTLKEAFERKRTVTHAS
jgi:hypothetical protein